MFSQDKVIHFAKIPNSHRLARVFFCPVLCLDYRSKSSNNSSLRFKAGQVHSSVAGRQETNKRIHLRRGLAVVLSAAQNSTTKTK